jgi:hypothetical protein
VQKFADVKQIGAATMVKCQTSLLALAEVLKKASYDRNAKGSLASAQASVAELLKSFAQFGACSDALSNALTPKPSAKPGLAPKAAATDAAPAVPAAAAAATVAPVAAPAASEAKRKAAAASARDKLAVKRQKKAEADAAFIAPSDDDDESDQGAQSLWGAGTDQEEPTTPEELATSGAWQASKSAPSKRAERLPPAAAAFAPPEHELDESSSADEEVLPPD